MPPHGPGDLAAQHAPHLLPFVGGLMFLLLLLLTVAAVAFLRRGGHLGAPPWARRPVVPETEARSILATRFATGDISSDEFLERASVLNWTPGVEPVAVPRKLRR